MHAYPYEGQRRINPDEIKGWARKTYNVELVNGFAGPVATTAAVECTGRVAGFMEETTHRAWYLRLGARGALVWKTEAVPSQMLAKDIVFFFSMGLGNGSVLPQPTGQFDLYCNDQLVSSFRVVKHSQTWRGHRAKFHFSANRIEAAPPHSALWLDNYLTNEAFAAFGIGFLRIPATSLRPGEPAILKVVPVSDVESTCWFQLSAAPINLGWVNPFSGLESLCNGLRPKITGYNVYFGDIHTHSGETHRGIPEGCGMGTRLESYRYAMGPGALEIYSLTDHERQILPEGIEEYLTLADKFNEDGQFVTLPGYEHTNQVYGHRNVYFRESGGTVIPASWKWRHEYWDDEKVVPPAELWAALEAHGVPAITIPHHMAASSHPLSWDFYHPRFDRLAEVYSGWGSSEYYGDYPRGVADRHRGLYLRDALDRGYRYGIIASSDGHDGHPGNAQSPLVKHHHIFHPLGSGWIAVLADNLTREEVFEAMHARRCYGTTGVPVVLDFTVNGEVMGSELAALRQGDVPSLHIVCYGSNGLDHVRIIKNGSVVETIPCHGEWQCDIEWRDPVFDRLRTNYYYVRVVQIDRESAWSSPIWVG